MKVVLSLDCTGETFACGILSENGIFTSVAGLNPRRALREVPSHLQHLLANAGVGREQVVGVGVTAGPGSFTGVRLGVTLAKTVALVCGCGVAALDTLELLARAQVEPFRHAPGKVGVALDARRGELYCGVFSLEEEFSVILPTAVRTPEVFARDLLNNENLRVLVGPGFAAYPELVMDGFRGPVLTGREHTSPSMPLLCRITLERFQRGALADPDELEPVYHRRADIQAGEAFP